MAERAPIAALAFKPADEVRPGPGFVLEGIVHRGAVPMVVIRRPGGQVDELPGAEAVALLAGDDDMPTPPTRQETSSFLILDDLLFGLDARQKEAAAFRFAAQSLVFDGRPTVHTALGEHMLLASRHLRRFAEEWDRPGTTVPMMLSLARDGRLLLRHSNGQPLRISRSSLYAWRRLAVLPGGIAYLTDRRIVASFQWLISEDAQGLMRHIRDYAEREATGPDRYLVNHHARCSAHLEKVAAPLLDRISRRRVDRLIRRVLRESLLHVDRDTRQSLNVHVATSGLGFRPSGPRQVIQIDATVLKAHALDIHGKRVKRAEVIVAIDMWNREFLDLVIVPGSPTAADVRMLLARLLLRARDTDDPSGNLMRLPSHISLTGGWDVEAISSMLTDRGSNIIAVANLQALATQGMSVGLAPPGRGDTKGAVEAFIRAVSSALQLFPGYTGRSGLGPRSTREDERLLSLADVEFLLRCWGHYLYNRRPHSGLRIDGTRMKVSPYAMLDAWQDLYGVPTRAITFDDVKPFLRPRIATLTSAGVLLDGQHYLDRDGHLLDLYAREVG